MIRACAPWLNTFRSVTSCTPATRWTSTIWPMLRLFAEHEEVLEACRESIATSWRTRRDTTLRSSSSCTCSPETSQPFACGGTTREPRLAWRRLATLISKSITRGQIISWNKLPFHEHDLSAANALIKHNIPGARSNWAVVEKPRRKKSSCVQ